MEANEEVPVVTCSNAETGTDTHTCIFAKTTTAVDAASMEATHRVSQSVSAGAIAAYKSSISLPVTAKQRERGEAKRRACHTSSIPERKVTEIEKEITSSEQTSEGFSPESRFSVSNSPPTVPKVFNFHQKTEDCVKSEECGVEEGSRRVFLFTASPSTTGEGVSGEGGGGEGRGGGGGGGGGCGCEE